MGNLQEFTICRKRSKIPKCFLPNPEACFIQKVHVILGNGEGKRRPSTRSTCGTLDEICGLV